MAGDQTLEPVLARGAYLHDAERSLPDPRSLRLAEVEQRFRYASHAVERHDLLLAASVISAYRHLMTGTNDFALGLKRMVRQAPEPDA